MALGAGTTFVLVLVIIMFVVALGCVINTVRTGSSTTRHSPATGPDRAALQEGAKVQLPGNKHARVQKYFPSTDRLKVTLSDTRATTTVDAGMVVFLEGPPSPPRPVPAPPAAAVLAPEAVRMEQAPVQLGPEPYSAQQPVDAEVAALWEGAPDYDGYVEFGVASFIEPEALSYRKQTVAGTNHKVTVKHLMGTSEVTFFTPLPYMEMEVPPQIVDVAVLSEM
jgi:hypothetical protein